MKSQELIAYLLKFDKDTEVVIKDKEILYSVKPSFNSTSGDIKDCSFISLKKDGIGISGF